MYKKYIQEFKEMYLLDEINLSDKINLSHKIRKELMNAIKDSDIEKGDDIQEIFRLIIENSDIGIMNRNEDRLRSLKNIILSYNSLYSYFAEEGGLNPITAHYKAEKYAIMIERAESENEVWSIYKEYFYDYIDKNLRILLPKNNSISDRINEYIDKNFTNSLSIKEISDEFHLNASYIMRTFKKETGNTIQQVITQKRIKEACRLLETSNLSITEISFMVGFNSPSYFSSVFKENTKISPQKYRENIKKSLF